MSFLRPFGAESIDHYKYEIKNLKAQIGSTPQDRHKACKERIATLNSYITALRQNLQTELKAKQALEAQAQLNRMSKLHTVMTDLSKCSPEVQRLRIENYTMEKQLETGYINPQQFFGDSLKQVEDRRRRAEGKQQELARLKIELEQLRKQQPNSIREMAEGKMSSRGQDEKKLEKYKRLILENEELKKVLQQKRVKEEEQKLKLSSTNFRSPELTTLQNTNKQLEAKIAQFENGSKKLESLIRSKQDTVQTIRKNNSFLKQKKARLTQSYQNSGAALPLHEEEQYRRLEAQYISLKSQLTLREVGSPQVIKKVGSPGNRNSQDRNDESAVKVVDLKELESKNYNFNRATRNLIFNDQPVLQSAIYSPEKVIPNSPEHHRREYNILAHLDFSSPVKQSNHNSPMKLQQIHTERSNISNISGNRVRISKLNPHLHALTSSPQAPSIPAEYNNPVAEKKQFDIRQMFQKW